MLIHSVRAKNANAQCTMHGVRLLGTEVGILPLNKVRFSSFQVTRAKHELSRHL